MRVSFLTLAVAASSTFFVTSGFADEFGSRFGRSAPYALNNGFDKAIADSQGISAEDLAKIAPAAGPTNVEKPAINEKNQKENAEDEAKLQENSSQHAEDSENAAAPETIDGASE